MVDIDYAFQGEGKAFQKFSEGIYNTLRARDINPSLAHKIYEYLKSIGMEEVQSRRVNLPVGKSSGELGELGLESWVQLLNSLKPHLAQVMYISSEEYDELQQDVYQELIENSTKIEIVCTYGKKP
ncbi:uncharacterized protein VTP21DRAFT_1094 [Calcarisporiella thermophila]|uniref:uncharacterized protein n=1 Tax=Calcarisporiella thermophila TaxID=911321 RepID=UPI0037429202